ncbi:4-oxalomesaconate tautomerase [Rhodoplanes sp. TEM]|uniref:4-oxalomesaconate tautomerase n=1 Tax=Rhodoplanes tepidamans TaxID=200616 RepID=A0ABT5JIT7_RHOTP|nr:MULTISPECIES: 4-oxalomesaconate tautomerase [Rhodoplanes]MDC7789628.1 4-oxalomesaconate tautomerase [Rhodoplanes tepidamans]MDC7987382.1 4-oxalomesaconate tautomerase [Rhodoplanes sp. TEM]MDQ0359181.1 2-methylaconitate cis-trans-isomerase PrpF [Rhodoplanes tepidamans]
MSKPAGLKKIPCVLMRGGTSRGPYFLESDLPADPEERDRVLIAAMGSPHSLQVDGIGGGHPLTSKVAIVAPSTRADADVEYLFAQVSVDRAFVDTSPNCGNMLSGVGPFAIEGGLVAAKDGETTVRIYNRNTRGLIEATVLTPGGVVQYDGDTAIDGVNGTAAPIRLVFLDAVGSKTSGLFPSGETSETIDGVRVTLADYAMPMMLVAAADLGIAGDETPEALDAQPALLARILALRAEAGRRMGLGDTSKLVIPKVGLLSAPRRGGTITSRYFVPDRCHRSHAVTGGLCVAVASRTPGTVAFDLAAPAADRGAVTIEHPSGRLDIALGFGPDGSVTRAGVIRTARRIFEGSLLVPAAVLAA